MTTSIQTHVDRFTRSEANRRLSAVLVWLPELLAGAVSIVIAVVVASLTGSTAATVVALLPAGLAGLRCGWAYLRNARRVRAARRMRQQQHQSSERVATDDETPDLVALITAEGEHA